MEKIGEIPYFVDAIGQPEYVCRHLLKDEDRKEIHFVSLKGKKRFAFCINCFTLLMKQAGYRIDEIDGFISKIAVPFEVGD